MLERLNRSDALGRLLDVLGAAILLILLSPVIAVVALGVRLSLGSPILFRQVRAGRNGAPFTILKFRTMEMRDSTCCGDPTACRGVQMAAGLHMSRFASTIRRTGLDELPQLVNILRGEMSFIGPRPLLVRYLARYTPEQRRRHDVRPGITGWAQVKGRTDLSWDDRLGLDVWYVDHRSRTLDLRIMRLTFAATVGGEGFSQVGSHTGPEFLGSGVPDGLCPATELPLATVRPGGAPVPLAGVQSAVETPSGAASGAR
jgi:lipopolysaccharide/colanic/teichoic acid biosynthesis glycosyltransferase